MIAMDQFPRDQFAVRFSPRHPVMTPEVNGVFDLYRLGGPVMTSSQIPSMAGCLASTPDRHQPRLEQWKLHLRLALELNQKKMWFKTWGR